MFQEVSNSTRGVPEVFQRVSRAFQWVLGLVQGCFKGFHGCSRLFQEFQGSQGRSRSVQGRSIRFHEVLKASQGFSRGLRGVPRSFRGVPEGSRSPRGVLEAPGVSGDFIGRSREYQGRSLGIYGVF